METTLNQILNLLIEPQGNLIYHTVLAFSVVMALQAALLNKVRMQKPVLRRTVLGLAVVLLFQLAMFLTSGLAWQGLFNAHLLIPPLDRAVLFITVAWIIWMWANPDGNRPADVGVAILTILAIILLIFTITSWNTEGVSQSFNGTYLDWGWQIATLAVCIIGLIGLFVRQPAGWEAGIGFLIIIMAGLGLHLIFLQPSADLSGIIRAFSLCAFPLLPVLAQRFPADKGEKNLPAAAGKTKGTEVNARKRLTSEPRTVSAWLKLANQTDPDQIQIALTRAISRTLLADFTFLVYIDQEMGSLEIKCGYDLIREEPIAGTRLSISSVPALVSSIQRGKPLRLSTNGTPPQDLISLTRVFGLNESGHLLAVPLMVNPGVWSAGLVLLTPYSNRLWNADDQNLLNGMSESLSQVLQRISAINDSRNKAEQSQYEINDLRRQVENLQVEAGNLRLAAENQSNQILPAYAPEMLPEMSNLMTLQQEAQNTIQRLQTENDELHRLLVRDGPFAELSETPASNDGELRDPITGFTHGIAARELQSRDEQEMIGLIDQEPDPSLLSSQQQLDIPADNPNRSPAFRDSALEHLPDWIAFEEIIDQAIAATSSKLLEKSIALQINFPESLAAVFVGNTIWREVLLELLQNATVDTPADGNIRLKIEIPETGQSPSLLALEISNCRVFNNGDGSSSIAENSSLNKSSLRYAGGTDLALTHLSTQVDAHGGSIQWNSTDDGGRHVSLHLPVQIRRDQSANSGH